MGTCRKLTNQLFKEFLDSFDTILLDCDGVLWHGNKAIPGAVESISKLRAVGKQPLFVTNNSTKSRAQYHEKFNKLGFVVSKDEIFGTAYTAALYMKYKLNFSGKVYLMGGKGMEEELALHGIQYTGTGPDPVQDSEVLEQLVNVELDPDVKGVVVGFDLHFSYMKLLKATSYLARPDSIFIGTNEDPQFPKKGSQIILPGTGSLVRPVEVASNRRATVLGKPNKFMFECIQEKFDVDPARTLMVGDRLSTDILLGKNSGLGTLAVLTGISTEDQILTYQASGDAEQGRMVPDYYVDSISQLGEWLE